MNTEPLASEISQCQAWLSSDTRGADSDSGERDELAVSSLQRLECLAGQVRDGQPDRERLEQAAQSEDLDERVRRHLGDQLRRGGLIIDQPVRLQEPSASRTGVWLIRELARELLDLDPSRPDAGRRSRMRSRRTRSASSAFVTCGGKELI